MTATQKAELIVETVRGDFLYPMNDTVNSVENHVIDYSNGKVEEIIQKIERVMCSNPKSIYNTIGVFLCRELRAMKDVKRDTNSKTDQSSQV